MSMLRIIPFVAGVLAAGGCDTSYCEQPHRVASSSDPRPGTVRAAAVLRTYANGVAALSDGSVVCLTCTGPVILDGALHPSHAIDRVSSHVAVGPDDTVYALVGGSAPFGTGSQSVAAFTRDGTLRWQTALQIGALSSIVPTRDAIYVPGVTGTAVLEPSTGQARSFPGSGIVVAGQADVFTVDSRSFTSRLTVRHLDAAGAVLWARSWTSATPQLIVYDAVATPDGGVIVVGRAEATIDFGDRMLEGPAARLLNFAVGVDAAGATQWAFSLPVVYSVRVALTPTGEILISGRAASGGDAGTDAFLIVATPAGIDHSYSIGGPADQDVYDMSVSSDGVAWLLVLNSDGEDTPDAVLKVGDHSFDDSGSYVIGIVP
jgi:hypothetical protein